MSLLIVGAAVDGSVVDLRVRDGVVTNCAPSVDRSADDDVIEAAGSALLPGLHDHHLHLHAMAAARSSVQCGPPDVTDLDSLHAALAAAPGNDWVRGVSYHESVTGPVDRALLDRLVPHRPTRIQHRSGGLWMLNSAAIERLGLTSEDGRLWRSDELVRADEARLPDLAEIGHRLLRLGITGVTDATPDLDAVAIRHLESSVAAGSLPQTVTALGMPEAWESPYVLRGPRKLLLHDHDLPTYPSLAETISRSREAGRPVAVHCVTRESLLLTIAVLDDVGVVSGDRIEHAAVVPTEMRQRIASMGIAVVTQPRFVYERGDSYLTDVDPDDVSCLYPYASLIAAGVAVAPSSDAPYADPDPWLTMAAARDRRTASGAAIGLDESVDAARVLTGYLSPPLQPGGRPRTIAIGQRADLCLLAVPLAEALANPSRDNVSLTIAGQHTWRTQS